MRHVRQRQKYTQNAVLAPFVSHLVQRLVLELMLAVGESTLRSFRVRSSCAFGHASEPATVGITRKSIH